MKLSWLLFAGCCLVAVEGFRPGLLRIESNVISKEEKGTSQEFGVSDKEEFYKYVPFDAAVLENWKSLLTMPSSLVFAHD